MKGQVSVEHLVLLGVVVAILIPGMISFYGSTSQQQQEYQNSQINNIGNEIVSTADNIYLLGEENRKTLKLDFPDNFRNITLEGNHALVITFEDSLGLTQAIFVSKAPLTQAFSGAQLEDIHIGKVDLTIAELNGEICIAPPGGYCTNTCGNGVIDTGETCDGQENNGLKCEDFGFGGGNLVCNSQCDGFLIDFCGNCRSLGDFCLDEGLQKNFFPFGTWLESNYVNELIGWRFPSHDRTEVSHDWFYDAQGWATLSSWTDVCGSRWGYKLKKGGAIQLKSIVGQEPGIFVIRTDLIYNTSDTDGHFGLQCDGQVTHINRPTSGDTNTVYSQCVFDSATPEIRFLGHGYDYVWIEEFGITKDCSLPTSCATVYDAGWRCLSQGHSVNGGDIESDFIKFERGFGDEGDVITWNTLLDNDEYDIPRYQRSCDEIYYGSTLQAPEGEQHDLEWKIKKEKIIPLLDPVNPDGEYELWLNIIWGNQSQPVAMKIRCGGNSWQPMRENNPSNGHLYMETYKYDCDFSAGAKKEIKIESTGRGKTMYIEQFRLRKKCN